MPKVTALKVQQRNRQRVNVYLDGEFAFGLYRLTAAWLQVGQDLGEEKIAQLKAQDGHEAAYQQALKFLNYRPRSSAEVRRNLEQQEFSEEVIAQTIERLHGNGLLDDARFAQSWVENRTDFRPRGRKALELELRQKGVERKDIEQAVAAVDEEGLAYQAALQHGRKLQDLPWLQFRQKLAAFLARRGFDYETTTGVVRRVWDEMHSNRQAE